MAANIADLSQANISSAHQINRENQKPLLVYQCSIVTPEMLGTVVSPTSISPLLKKRDFILAESRNDEVISENKIKSRLNSHRFPHRPYFIMTNLSNVRGLSATICQDGVLCYHTCILQGLMLTLGHAFGPFPIAAKIYFLLKYPYLIYGKTKHIGIFA